MVTVNQRPSTRDRGLHTPPPSVNGALWSVGSVAARLAIAGPTLRTWDRRYGLGPSLRTEGGHRRYSETDVSRIELMSRLVDEGVPAAEAAQVALSREESALRSTPRPSERKTPTSARRTVSCVDALVRAATVLDAATLSRLGGHVLDRRGVVAGWTQVLAPALREIGDRWATGEVGVEVEHLMSERLGAELRSITQIRRVHRAVTALVVMASAVDEQHYLPVVALEAALAERRIPSVSLGPRTPAGALEAAVVRRAPKVVFLWRSLPPADDDVDSPADSRVLRDQHVVLGGPGWRDVAGQSRPVQVAHVHDMASAVDLIESLVRT